MPDFREAIRQAIAEEMTRDERVILIGEDVADAGGVFKVTEGLVERFGSRRVVDTPISELALAGTAFGSAVAGLRPIVEIMFGDFMALPMDSLVNQAAKFWYLSGGAASVPLVVRSAVGAGGRFGAVHSQNPGIWLHGVPGLKVVCPSSPSDARLLLKASIQDPNPVVFLEHKRLYNVKGEFEDGSVKLGQAKVVRTGSDLTIAAVMKGVPDALEAADALADAGVQVEVIDMRGLRPLDVDTVLESVGRTGRLLVVEEGPQTGGWAAGLLGAVVAVGLGDLDDAWLLTTPDSPIPFSPPLEDSFLPGPEHIRASVLERLQVAA
jgi:acetoin:2,6-dichlorophenolindophenol oxidoreductase subunit beta